MNRRLLGNILIVILLILIGSGLAMYFTPFSKSMASLHTFFALLFIAAMVFHIINNKTPLKSYISGKKQSRIKKLQSPFVFSLILVLAFGLYSDFPILNSLYNFGNGFRNERKCSNYKSINTGKTCFWIT